MEMFPRAKTKHLSFLFQAAVFAASLMEWHGDDEDGIISCHQSFSHQAPTLRNSVMKELEKAFSSSVKICRLQTHFGSKKTKDQNSTQK